MNKTSDRETGLKIIGRTELESHPLSEDMQAYIVDATVARNSDAHVSHLLNSVGEIKSPIPYLS